MSVERLDLVRIRALRRLNGMGAEAELHECIDSTNTRARTLAKEGAPHGTLVLAESQTAGRGRFDRKFYSPPGSGVYLSLILRPDFGADRAALLTPLAAVATARAIEYAGGVEAKIKWVNDVYIGNKKACGILCEASLKPTGGVDYVIVGIGVNVGLMSFPEELREIATSVSNEAGRAVSANLLTARLLDEIEALLADAQSDLMCEYRTRSNVIGKRVTVLRGDERFEALAKDIDAQGSLIIRKDGGEEIALHSGEISIRFR